MRFEFARALAIAAAGLWLAGCSTSNKLSDMLGMQDKPADTSGVSAMASADPIAAEPAPLGVPAAAEPGLLGGNAADDLAKGKQEYRANNFGMAERYFRRAAEMHPRDAEAWLGLAAAYDRLRRFDLADRAYGQAIRIVGPTAEILNNQGYSYMLRGDFRTARAKLELARRKDPNNKFVANNLALLVDAARKGKAVE
jgi:tetratricopeptide (TPR) repeat protein